MYVCVYVYRSLHVVTNYFNYFLLNFVLSLDTLVILLFYNELFISITILYLYGLATTPAFQYNGGVRLIGGPYRSEGRLQLYFFGVWGGVCGRSFDTLATDGVCNRLGYSHSTGISYVGRYIHTKCEYHCIINYLCTATCA